jgi:hypothetical protein
MDLIAVLQFTIHSGQGMGGDSVSKEGGITLDQQDCQPLEEVPDGN